MAIEDLPQWKDRLPGEPVNNIETVTDEDDSGHQRPFPASGSAAKSASDYGLSDMSGNSEPMTAEERDLENTWSDPDGR